MWRRRGRSPRDIALDPALSMVRKIELLKSYKEHYAAPGDAGLIRDCDLELSRLLSGTSVRH